MLSYTTSFTACIKPNKSKAHIPEICFEASVFSIPYIDFYSSVPFNSKSRAVDLRLSKKYPKEDLIYLVKEQLKAQLNAPFKRLILSDDQALTIAHSIVDNLTAKCPDVIKQSWRAEIKKDLKIFCSLCSLILSDILANLLRKLRSFKFPSPSVYIPRRYLVSPTWGGTLFRFVMASVFALPAFALANVTGAGLAISSAAAMACGFLGYSGIAYKLQTLFYGKNIAFFRISERNKVPYPSDLDISGRNCKTPYLRTLAGVEQDFSHLLQKTFYYIPNDHLPLFSRYHALEAALNFPQYFYENEHPLQKTLSELEKEVRRKIPYHLPELK